MRYLSLLLVPLVLLGCHRCCQQAGTDPTSSVTRFPAADSGRYGERFEILLASHPVAVRMEPLRADAEAHENVLRKLTRDRLQIKQPLEFRYMFTGYDSLNNRAVLRFFARSVDQKEIAGWQLQLLYDGKTLRPIRAYVQPLPLE